MLRLPAAKQTGMLVKAVVRQFLAVFGFWLIFFALLRPFFWFWQDGLEKFSLFDFALAFCHGLYMDLSMAGYFSLIPLLVLSFRCFIPALVLETILKIYHYLLILLVSLMAVTDLEIFSKWGHRLDSAVLPYLEFPAEAFASTLSSPIHWLILFFFILSFSGIFLWRAISGKFLIAESEIAAWIFPRLILTAACILPIRGGLQLAPMNQSSVYFSDTRILNQAAENPVWVFFQSVLEDSRRDLAKLYSGADPERAKAFCDSLYRDNGAEEMVLKTSKPNIILIIWESLSAKVAGCSGGKFPSTPTLDRLAASGLLFTGIYANGDRSDKGLVSILSAQPAFGKISLMSHPDLSAGFDFISKRLKKSGYKTQYLYGGELAFANMKSYLLNAGFDKLTGKEDFPPESWNSKWGAHDGALFDRQLLEASKEQQPFFHTLFTLSSHEPFEVPGVENKPGTAQDTLFCRAHRYTDRCLGDWVKKAEKQAWWKNSLVIVIADHGHAQPGSSGESDPEKFRIPMLWFGPALGKKGLIEKKGNQTDLLATLSHQLGDSSRLPAFSKNLLSDKSLNFAFFAFRNGCSFIGSNGRALPSFDGASDQNEAALLFRQQAIISIMNK
jgi:phosphoglycerol transferase MdoB-like AlkP superfamily enzyme